MPMSTYDYSPTGLDDYFPERAGERALARSGSTSSPASAARSPHHLRDLTSALADRPADVEVGDVALASGPLLHKLGGPPFASFGISTVAVPARTCRRSDSACRRSDSACRKLPVAGGDCATGC